MEDKQVTIHVALKHMGNVAKKVKAHPLTLARTPDTFGELIEETVRACIAAYRQRDAQGSNPVPLTDEQWDGMQEIGKFAFGLHYNQKEIDEAQALQTAIDAITDGLVRVFYGTNELTDLNAPIELSDGSVFTFVRLTMLSGRMW